MTRRKEDDLIRQDFERLRSETEASGRVPEFGVVMARAKADAAASLDLPVVVPDLPVVVPDLRVVAGDPTPSAPQPSSRRVLRIGGWASAALAAGVAAILLVPGGSDADDEFDRLVSAYASDAAAGAWTSPTATLLDVPGMHLTRSVPSLGGAVRGLDPAGRPSGPDREGRDS